MLITYFKTAWRGIVRNKVYSGLNIFGLAVGRKVLGASAAQVVVLLMRDFVWLVGISCLIATPLAFYFLERWLEGYYYRIHVGPGVFVLSTVGAFCITVVTISFQSLKAAWMNPVESLRAE